jgi:L-amino acid N-acyltransferase YncA
MALDDNAPVLRTATEGDMTRIQEIYAHHVLHGLASFEEVTPDVAELTRRFHEVTAQDFPYVVTELGGKVQGYAYAGPYRHRTAYRYSVENSIYVDPSSVGKGLGRLLLAHIIERCTQLGYRQMIAVIGDSENHPSINLHKALGFERSGLQKSVGFKFGRWVDSVFMQLDLGDGATTPPDF